MKMPKIAVAISEVSRAVAADLGNGTAYAWHQAAMLCADNACFADFAGEGEYRGLAAEEWNRAGMAAEWVAWEETPAEDRLWKAVLARSCAWLAVHCGEYDVAIEVATEALETDAPAPIDAELREVLAEAGKKRRGE